MKTIVTSAKMLNAKVEYFNDLQCRNFIEKHFDNSVLKAYDSLIPTAYKADLWRYCVLYINGGIYSDLSQTVLKKYNINEDDADIILTKDRIINTGSFKNNIFELRNPIQISFMAVKPQNYFFKYVIENIVIDILYKNKGNGTLDVTGPIKFGRLFCKFFNIKDIKFGFYIYKGINNKYYKVYLKYYLNLSGNYLIDTKNNSKWVMVVKKMIIKKLILILSIILYQHVINY